MATRRKTSWLGDVFTLFFLIQIYITVSLSAEIRVPYDYATITEALVVADDNDTIDTILVAPGTYSEPNESFPLRIRKAITLMCDTDDPNDRPHLKGDGKHTVVLIESGGVTLKGFQITDGSGSEGINSMDGGGICVFVAPGEIRDVKIVNCLIENNTCPSDETYDGCGGGIYCGGTYCECFTVNISNCIIRNNYIRGCGGGVFCALLSIVVLDDTYVEDNTADDHGGGVFVDFYASIYMNDTHMVRNNCPGDSEKENWGGKGGGVACESLGVLTATDCLFAENTAKYFGGGIFTRGGLFDLNDLCGRNSEFSYVSNSLIQKNRADVSGGGAYIASSGILGFSNTTIYWNDAGQDGGAVSVAGGAMGGGVVDFNNGCLLEGNECAGRGGGIYLGSNALGTFEFTRFLGNSALFDGGAVFLEEDASSTLTECLITYNNSARGYAGGIRAASQSWLDLVHCSIVGNFAPFKRSGLYLDPNSVVNIRDSILWRNAGGSIEANGAAVNITTSLSEDGADPNNSVICCDPKYVGWDGLEEIYVDSSGPYPGLGTLDNPYYDLQVALDDFDFSLAENSPCVNAASDGGNMGADTGVGDTAGNVTAKINIFSGTYDIRGRNIAFINSIEGIDPNTSVIRHAVLGCTENASIANLGITGEEIFGGITIRSDAKLENCHVNGNTALANGGGIYVAEGHCDVNNTIVTENTCERDNGGGIFVAKEANMGLVRSRIGQNVAAQGGAIFIASQVTTTDANITDNTATDKGGGIYIETAGDLISIGDVFSFNNARYWGGAICSFGKMRIQDAKFISNTTDYGGAIYIRQESAGASICSGSEFKNNKVNHWGGAIYLYMDTSPQFSNCNFLDNEARYRGGAGVCWDRCQALFDGCSFRNNVSNYGGSFYISLSKTRFKECVFSESSARFHGGVASFFGADTSFFEKCFVEDSVAGTDGGAFYISGKAQPVFCDVNIMDCQATNYGGGIAILSSSKPVFVDVSFSNCNAVCGGGVYAGGDSQSIFQQCEFLKNSADGPTISPDGGGAWLTENSKSSFVQCKFKENLARDDGGGISVAGPSRIDLWNSLFVDNIANNTGGGIHFTSTSMGIGTGFITNCTIFRNTAKGANGGGGICLDTYSDVTVDSSIICQNSPDGIPCNANNPNLSISYSCLQEICAGLVDGNKECDDCLLDTNTFELQDGSQCIDAGNPDPNMNDAHRPPGMGELRNDMGFTGGPYNYGGISHDRFNFHTFSEFMPLVLRGNASFSEGVLSLTKAEQWQVGGAWYAFTVDVQGGFETEFDFRIDRDGRDGIAFVIQNDGLTALGNNAEYIGYNILNSIAVEFDTCKNGNCGDTNANHISIQTRGNQTNSPNHEYSWAYNDSIPFLSDNQVHTAKVIYVPGELSVFVDDMEIPALITSIKLENELSLMGGRAYIGFTSSTRGSSVETHDILRWSFATTVPQ